MTHIAMKPDRQHLEKRAALALDNDIEQAEDLNDPLHPDFP